MIGKSDEYFDKGHWMWHTWTLIQIIVRVFDHVERGICSLHNSVSWMDFVSQVFLHVSGGKINICICSDLLLCFHFLFFQSEIKNEHVSILSLDQEGDTRD